MNYEVIKVFKKNSSFTPEVKLINCKGQKVICKDYSACLAITKSAWGRALINNEFNILKHLNGIKGIPAVIDRFRDAIMLEYLEGEPLSRTNIPYEIFPKIEALIKAIHSKGVVHLDLAQKKNILITPAGAPCLIDFANAMHLRLGSFGFRQLFDYLCLIDRASLLKFKNRYFPDKMSAADKKFLKRFWLIRRLWFFSPKTFRSSDRI